MLVAAVRSAAHEAADASYAAGDRMGLPDDEAYHVLHEIADAASADVSSKGLAAQVEFLSYGRDRTALRSLLERLVTP